MVDPLEPNSDSANANPNSTPPPNVNPATTPEVEPVFIPQSFCPTGYVDIEGSCFLKIEWCVGYNKTNGLCEECELGYLPGDQGVCIHELLAFFQRNRNFEEQAEEAGTSQVVPATTSAPPPPPTPAPAPSPNPPTDPMGPICTSYNPQTGMCSRCRDGFDVFNGLCVQRAPQPTSTPAPTPLPAPQTPPTPPPPSSQNQTNSQCNSPC